MKKILMIMCLMFFACCNVNNVSANTNNVRDFQTKKSLTQLNDVKENSEYSVKERIKARVSTLLTCARQYTGVPYNFGGATPRGFDCSGYLKYIFREALGMDIPRTADQQYLLGQAVSRDELEPGDLVFFTTYEPGVSHSGVYVGNGKFISATSSQGIAIADMTRGYWHNRYWGAKRIL